METIFYILIISACFASFLTVILSLVNIIILFFLGGFLVNFRERLFEFFRDVMGVVAETPEPLNLPIEQETSSKTWDEKYEEELLERERLRRLERNELDKRMPPL